MRLCIRVLSLCLTLLSPQFVGVPGHPGPYLNAEDTASRLFRSKSRRISADNNEEIWSLFFFLFVSLLSPLSFSLYRAPRTASHESLNFSRRRRMIDSYVSPPPANYLSGLAKNSINVAGARDAATLATRPWSACTCFTTGSAWDL